MDAKVNVLIVLAVSMMLCFVGALIGAGLYRAFDLTVIGDRTILVSMIGFAVSFLLIIIVGFYTAATLGTP